MIVAVSAVQGAFIEHERILRRLGAETIELREKKDAEKSFDALVLPGGESTAQGKLLRELGMFDTLKRKIDGGIPVLATCAGLILLARRIENDSRTHFQTLPVTVRRNAYGRQLGSFYTESEMKGVFGKIPMTFIRAPYITEASPDAEILAEVGGNAVAVRYKNQLALSFHPELSEDTRIHEYFLKMA